MIEKNCALSHLLQSIADLAGRAYRTLISDCSCHYPIISIKLIAGRIAAYTVIIGAAQIVIYEV